MPRVIPDVVRQFVARSVDDPTTPRGTHLEQEGTMRLSPGQRWMPFTAEQVIDGHRTHFVWHARVRMFPCATAVVEDAFEDGHGRLDAKIWGLISVARARGPRVDQGEAQRYLAELPWCPHAFLHHPGLELQQVAPDAVSASLGDASVTLFFDDAGDIVRAHTDARPRDHDSPPWGGTFSDYREFGDVRAPAYGEVSWQLPEGAFCYWRGTVRELGFRSEG